MSRGRYIALDSALLSTLLSVNVRFESSALMAPSKKHHFLPVFYLSRWTGEHGTLIEYKRPYQNRVRSKERHPQGTGYIERLYAVEGLPDVVANEMEHQFFSPVDGRAASALVRMLKYASLTDRQAEAWVDFLASLLFRMPNDVDTFRTLTAELASKLASVLQPVYDGLHPLPEKRDFENIAREVGAQAAIDLIRQAITDGRFKTSILGMRWRVIDSGEQLLLTSDRPVVHTPNLVGDGAGIMLPVSPTKLFVATSGDEADREVASAPPHVLAQAMNAAIVGRARRIVVAQSRCHEEYIQDTFGTDDSPSLADRLADVQRQQLPTIMAALKLQADKTLRARLGESKARVK
ncbi:DUF4238 domain-containing protein [Sinorhizobium sp. GL28]|uniref:DUF4238 domain-containing protein n=1 Tax=Sinorhizobium sp. GL28 TaxID=1358418 RepID=UPI00071C66E1|nr:DUF4238 domain-containing protein [Sinorhizobium sp. GL28]